MRRRVVSPPIALITCRRSRRHPTGSMGSIRAHALSVTSPRPTTRDRRSYSCQIAVRGGRGAGRKSGPFSGKAIAPTDLDAHVGLPGEDSARIGVVANYDENGEMLPSFREFEVDKPSIVE